CVVTRIVRKAIHPVLNAAPEYEQHGTRKRWQPHRREPVFDCPQEPVEWAFDHNARRHDAVVRDGPQNGHAAHRSTIEYDWLLRGQASSPLRGAPHVGCFENAERGRVPGRTAAAAKIDEQHAAPEIMKG